ncbi:hypothetical protein F8388_010563 [Cannabis sativa]|uniref:Uncharacterized protein n=1 Tax=Cannabis sativa TaxID=3483 RepID=A0A7J6GPW1_CANSA|nr:hypothetical protein F8388_010563 [Cannabis sativa]
MENGMWSLLVESFVRMMQTKSWAFKVDLWRWKTKGYERFKNYLSGEKEVETEICVHRFIEW